VRYAEFVTDSKLLFTRKASSSPASTGGRDDRPRRHDAELGGQRVRAARDDTKPFDVSAVIGFKWSPVDAARAYTSEEDLLTDLVRRRRRFPRTEPQVDAGGPSAVRKPPVWFDHLDPCRRRYVTS
jgi:hypothetical protein